MIHKTANIWGEIISLPDDISIGAFCDLGNPNFGTGCKVQTMVSIPPGWKIGQNVFIGPGARFANDKHPDLSTDFLPATGEVGDGAVIGMGAIILPVKIGAYAVIGAGAVVTKDVPPNQTWVGNPAHPI